MKIRNGFVSNSSSSSFMLGIAIIEDMGKFQKWFSSLTSKRDTEIILASTFLKDSSIIQEHNFQSDVNIPLSTIKDDTLLFILNIVNNEGDSAFYDKYGYDLNYDIDLDFFDPADAEIYNGMIEENGLTQIDKTYGAARNG